MPIIYLSPSTQEPNAVCPCRGRRLRWAWMAPEMRPGPAHGQNRRFVEKSVENRRKLQDT